MRLIMDSKEITDIVYDTLMQNKQHRQLELDSVENPEVDRKRGWITFDYGNAEVHINIYYIKK